jgi:AmmeMemoRadiSam system protein B
MDITGAISQDNKVHQQFSQYLTRTKNTICGRHPIGVLLAAMESVDEPLELRWVRYAQSSACMSVRDSSVSYASGYVSARV